MMEDNTNVIAVANLVINPNTYTVIKSEETINLTRKEFHILYFLISNSDIVLSRSDIFKEAWGEDIIVGNRTIDVHIRRLREKIGDDYIKTIKGVGYQFSY